MSLDASIQVSADRIGVLLDRLKGHLQGACGPGVPEFAQREIASAIVMIASVRAECNGIRASLAAARSTGQMAAAVAAKDLELHPVNLPPQVPSEKLLESLHRSGDHTLDPDNANATQEAAA